MVDKIAVLEPLDEGNTLIRGTGFGSLGQFHWCALVPSGAVIPDEKIPTARQALTAMGYRIVDPAHTPTPPRDRHGWYHPSGEELTCPRCNPAHTDTTVKDAAVTAIRATIAAINARTADTADPPLTRG